MNNHESKLRAPPAGAEHQQQELSALDEMFQSSSLYRHSDEWLQLLEFISRFRTYAPFNGMLLHIQRPDATYVATASDWRSVFGRTPKREARPLLILQPFGPVMFLYELADTEGNDVPAELLHPFQTTGFLSRQVLEITKHNAALHAIAVREIKTGLNDAGRAMRLNAATRDHYAALKLPANAIYLILLNDQHSVEEEYSSLAHELAHIFCGHLGADDLAWWEPHTGLSLQVREIEAESVSFLVCRRQNLLTTSEKYLASYRKSASDLLPAFSPNALFQSTDYIEKMGHNVWKKPLKAPKK